jgi:alkylation response protein AidB-like acyl-CoA dehydrogenase
VALWALLEVAAERVGAERSTQIADRAALQVGAAARRVAQESVQLHGGIGLTAEHVVGHRAARLTAIGLALGDRRQILRGLGATVREHDHLVAIS